MAWFVGAVVITGVLTVVDGSLLGGGSAARTGWLLTGSGAVLATVVVLANRRVFPFAGVVTTVLGVVAGLFVLWGDEGGGWVDLLAGLTSVPVVPTAFALAVTGAGYAVGEVPADRRWWAVGVGAAGAGAWLGWMGWWVLDEVPPTGEGWLTLGAALTLVGATVVGELTVRPWLGATLAVVPAAALAFGPLVAADALGVIAWFILVAAAAAGCFVTAAGVAFVRRLGGPNRRESVPG